MGRSDFQSEAKSSGKSDVEREDDDGGYLTSRSKITHAFVTGIGSWLSSPYVGKFQNVVEPHTLRHFL